MPPKLQINSTQLKQKSVGLTDRKICDDHDMFQSQAQQSKIQIRIKLNPVS